VERSCLKPWFTHSACNAFPRKQCHAAPTIRKGERASLSQRINPAVDNSRITWSASSFPADARAMIWVASFARALPRSSLTSSPCRHDARGNWNRRLSKSDNRPARFATGESIGPLRLERSESHSSRSHLSAGRLFAENPLYFLPPAIAEGGSSSFVRDSAIPRRGSRPARSLRFTDVKLQIPSIRGSPRGPRESGRGAGETEGPRWGDDARRGRRIDIRSRRWPADERARPRRAALLNRRCWVALCRRIPGDRAGAGGNSAGGAGGAGAGGGGALVNGDSSVRMTAGRSRRAADSEIHGLSAGKGRVLRVAEGSTPWYTRRRITERTGCWSVVMPWWARDRSSWPRSCQRLDYSRSRYSSMYPARQVSRRPPARESRSNLARSLTARRGRRHRWIHRSASLLA